MKGRKQLGDLKKKQVILYIAGESIDYLGGLAEVQKICYKAVEKNIRSKKWKESTAQSAPVAQPAAKRLPKKGPTRKKNSENNNIV